MFDIVSPSSTEVIVTYYNINRIRCEKCDGTGYQQRGDMVYVICPICEGTGVREQKGKIECEPCVPHYPYPQYTDNTIKR